MLRVAESSVWAKCFWALRYWSVAKLSKFSYKKRRKLFSKEQRCLTEYYEILRQLLLMLVKRETHYKSNKNKMKKLWDLFLSVSSCFLVDIWGGEESGVIKSDIKVWCLRIIRSFYDELFLSSGWRKKTVDSSHASRFRVEVLF